MSALRRASVVFPKVNNVIFIGEIEIAVFARPGELIDDVMAHKAVIRCDGGIIGMSLLESFVGVVAVVLSHMHPIAHHLFEVKLGVGEEEIREIVFWCFLNFVRQPGAIPRSGQVGEVIIDGSVLVVDGVDIIIDIAYAIVKMDVKKAGVGGMDRLQVEPAGRFVGLGIDDESIDPVVGAGRKVGKDLIHVPILERMAGEGRDIRFAGFKQPVPPLEIIDIRGIDGQRHELLLMGIGLHG